MASLRVLLLSVLLTQLGTTFTQQIYECDESSSSNGICVLKDVQLPSPDDINSIELPAEQSVVQFINGNIPDFGQPIYGQLEITTNLTITRSALKKLFVGSLLVHLNASWNSLTRLDRASNEDYSNLKVLVLSHNSFDRVPNVKDFVAIEWLDLSHNELDFINLDIFGRLQKLKLLDLTSNKIRSLDTEKGFRLPSLTEFRLADNQLLELDLTNWSLQNLAKLDVSSNLLLYMNGADLNGSLSKLTQLGLAGNQWNCRALAKLIESLQKSSISVTGASVPCPANYTTIQGVCCLDSYVSYVALQSQWDIRKLQREMRTMNETLVQKLAAVRGEQGSQIALLERKLSTQEKRMVRMKQHLLTMARMIEDLIEELYLREKEAESVYAQTKQHGGASVRIVF
ncbi:platelet glycoprotein V-like [Topomyia yanbarensis]|uniref:platelet glycoprotein V-like n=1 Tax=Topomyia yanbarensis TaxID=2498891 RepID=UPI00273C79E4|nr:platelet glycoprotein V-like [Topomyia yanbarensis]